MSQVPILVRVFAYLSILHVRRHLDAAKNVRLANLVELDCVAASPHFLAMLNSIDLEPKPPDVGTWHLLENASFLANHLPRHRESAFWMRS
jgi:hypothetical protein